VEKLLSRQGGRNPPAFGGLFSLELRSTELRDRRRQRRQGLARREREAGPARIGPYRRLDAPHQAPDIHLRKGEAAVDIEDDEGISLEEILVEMIDAQIALIEAVAGGKPLPDAENLRGRLNDLRDLLEQAVMDPDED
jgi:hypothetical protein